MKQTELHEDRRRQLWIRVAAAVAGDKCDMYLAATWADAVLAAFDKRFDAPKDAERPNYECIHAGSMSFDINHPGEKGAGLVPYSDVVTVRTESGLCAGKWGEFQAYMRDCLAKWYDGAQVHVMMTI